MIQQIILELGRKVLQIVARKWYNAVYDKGCADGHNKGFDEGYEKGYADGKIKGHNEGYNKGSQDAGVHGINSDGRLR